MPILWIIGGLIGVLGLSLFNGTITKVEKLVDSPIIEIGVIAVIIIVVYFILVRK